MLPSKRHQGKGDRSAAFDYRTYLDEVVRRGHFFTVPRGWARTLGLTTAALVAYLLNCGRSSANDGWIPASERFVETGIGMNEDRQRRILEWLVEERLAEVKHFDRSGMGNVRHIRINTHRLENTVRALLQQEGGQR